MISSGDKKEEDMADPISSTDDALMRYNAENFLNLAKNITQQSEFIKQFDRLTPIVQEHVVLELCDHDNKRLLDLLPYKKYEVGYNKVIKDNIERSPGLIKEILKTYYEDMQEFLVSLFQGAMSENSCIVVAEVLAKTVLGLGVLDVAIQKGDSLHQVCAIKGVNKIIDVNYYPVIEARNSNMRHRPIGIGVQGFADAFIMLGIPF